jgi:hypothetical protein
LLLAVKLIVCLKMLWVYWMYVFFSLVSFDVYLFFLNLTIVFCTLFIDKVW